MVDHRRVSRSRVYEQEKRFLRPLRTRPFASFKVALVTSSKTACVTFETCRDMVPVWYANQSRCSRLEYTVVV